MEANPDLQLTFVLGVHRSGTSLLTSGLQAMGLSAAGVASEQDGHNPRGYFEHARVRDLNDRLLRHLGSAWDDPAFDAIRILGPRALNRLTPWLREAEQVLRADFAGQTHGLLKDPRVSQLLPFWNRVVKNLGLRPRHVLILRHPDEVNESQRQRAARKPADFRPFDVYRLWFVLMRGILRALPAPGVMLLRHDRLIADPRATLAPLAPWLDVEPDPLRLQAWVAEFHDPSLYRARLGADRAAEASDTIWRVRALSLWHFFATYHSEPFLLKQVTGRHIADMVAT